MGSSCISKSAHSSLSLPGAFPRKPWSRGVTGAAEAAAIPGPAALDGTRAFGSSESVQPCAHPLSQIEAPGF